MVGLLLIELASAAVERMLVPDTFQMPQPLPGPNLVLQERLLAERQERGLEIAMREVGVDAWELPFSDEGTQGGVPFRTNSLGLRGPEVTPLQPTEVRVLTSGDSSIFGYGVPERAVFSSVLAETLAAKWQRPVSALNGGVPGHTAPAVVHALGERLRKLTPDFLVVATLWSDVYGAPGLVATDHLRGFGRHFAAYRIARRLLASSLGSRQVGFINRREDVGALVNGVPTRTSLETYYASLARIAQISTQAGVQPVFVVLPAPMDFDDFPVPATVRVFREALCEAAASVGAPCVDAVACFQEAGAGAAWFLDQVHPAVAGHALLAECLEPVFAEPSVEEGADGE